MRYYLAHGFDRHEVAPTVEPRLITSCWDRPHGSGSAVLYHLLVATLVGGSLGLYLVGRISALTNSLSTAILSMLTDVTAAAVGFPWRRGEALNGRKNKAAARSQRATARDGWPLRQSGIYFGIALGIGAACGITASGSIGTVLMRRLGDAGKGIALTVLSIIATVTSVVAGYIEM